MTSPPILTTASLRCLLIFPALIRTNCLEHKCISNRVTTTTAAATVVTQYCKQEFLKLVSNLETTVHTLSPSSVVRSETSLGSHNRWNHGKNTSREAQASKRKGTTVCRMSQQHKEFAFSILLDKGTSELTFFSLGYNDVLQKEETFRS